jgi:hypothetical protein
VPRRGAEYGAPRGDHDDLVLAAGYAQMALHEVARVKEEDLPLPEGSAGDVFGIKREKFNPRPKQADPFERGRVSMSKRSRQARRG